MIPTLNFGMAPWSGDKIVHYFTTVKVPEGGTDPSITKALRKSTERDEYVFVHGYSGLGVLGKFALLEGVYTLQYEDQHLARLKGLVDNEKFLGDVDRDDLAIYNEEPNVDYELLELKLRTYYRDNPQIFSQSEVDKFTEEFLADNKVDSATFLSLLIDAEPKWEDEILSLLTMEGNYCYLETKELYELVSPDINQNFLDRDRENLGRSFIDMLREVENLPNTTQNQDTLRELVKKAFDENTTSSNKKLCLEMINYGLTYPYEQAKEANTLEYVQDYLDDHVYGMKKVKQHLYRYLAKLHFNPQLPPKPLLFLGSPGVGKTYVSRLLSKALGLNYSMLSISSADIDLLKGSTKVYIGSEPSFLIKEVTKHRINNPVVVFDEIDKVASDAGTRQGNIVPVLLEILDPNQNKRFYDQFLEMYFDLSNVWFVATANYEDKISEPLKDRFEIIKIPDYQEEEKLAILDNYLWPNNVRESGLEQFEIEFISEARKYLVGQMKDPGVRQLNRRVSEICGGIALDIYNSQLGSEGPIIIDKKAVDDYALLNDKSRKRFGFNTGD